MNSEAKRMMLLGSLDGHFDDLSKMLKAHNVQTVACLHSNDNPIAVFTSAVVAETVEIQVFHVELRPLNFGRTRVGSIGKCTCGKIYYTED